VREHQKHDGAAVTYPALRPTAGDDVNPLLTTEIDPRNIVVVEGAD
jgi:hypothetical protein